MSIFENICGSLTKKKIRNVHFSVNFNDWSKSLIDKSFEKQNYFRFWIIWAFEEILDALKIDNKLLILIIFPWFSVWNSFIFTFWKQNTQIIPIKFSYNQLLSFELKSSCSFVEPLKSLIWTDGGMSWPALTIWSPR